MVDADHYRLVLDRLLRGEVVPLLGAGAGSYLRPAAVEWRPGDGSLPRGGELARRLASEYYYDDSDVENLIRVAQYVAVTAGSGPLYSSLRALFNAEYEPSPLHAFLARLPAVIRETQSSDDVLYPILMTTNYDDCLEQALRNEGEAFDVVTYLAESEHQGKFAHHAWGEERPRVIHRPNSYTELAPHERPIVFKVHGAVDRREASGDSYVVTENDYLDYLVESDGTGFVPAPIAEVMGTSHFLFMGYSLRDWNLRVVLERIWRRQTLKFVSWSVQRHVRPADRFFWAQRNVEVVEADIADYLSGLEAALDERRASP